MWVEPAQLAHVPLIADNARQADVDEVAASHGHAIERALELSIRLSLRAWLIGHREEPIGLFGVATSSVLSGRGSPWFLGTNAAERYPVAFLRASRDLLPEVTRGFRVLENWVDERNTVSQRWLGWLGFELSEPQPWGREGRLFRHFQMRTNDV